MAKEQDGAVTTERSWIKGGSDIWIRARTNAMAHKLEAESKEKTASIVYFFEVIFLVASITLVGASVYLGGTRSLSSPAPGNTALDNLSLGIFEIAALLVILFNGIALLLGMWSRNQKWSEKGLQHRWLLSSDRSEIKTPRNYGH